MKNVLKQKPYKKMYSVLVIQFIITRVERIEPGFKEKGGLLCNYKMFLWYHFYFLCVFMSNG